MQVFLDTCAINEDPLLTSAINGLLLDCAKKGKILLYMPEVVYAELRNNYLLETAKLTTEIRAKTDRFTRFIDTKIRLDLPDEKAVSMKFDTFYRKLFDDKVIQLLPTDNAILPELIELAVKKKKPLNIKGEQFRDGVIWLTIRNFINSNQPTHPFFVSNNTGDFYNNDKNALHEDLQAQCPGLRAYNTVENLLIQETTLLHLDTKLEFEIWVRKQPFDHSWIRQVLKTKLQNEARDKMIECLLRFNIKDYAPLITSNFQIDLENLDQGIFGGLEKNLIGDTLFISVNLIRVADIYVESASGNVRKTVSMQFKVDLTVQEKDRQPKLDNISIHSVEVRDWKSLLDSIKGWFK